MPFLPPMIAAVGAAAASVGITAQMVIGLLINIGFALLQMAMMRQPKPEDVVTVVQQSTAIRQVHLGRLRTGGARLFIESTGRTLYQVIYFSEGPADGYEEWFIDQRSVEVDGDGWVTSPPYGSKGGRRVRIMSRAGSVPSQAYDPLRAAFAGTVNHAWRGDGLATALLTAKSVKPEFVAKHYPNRIPVLNVIGRFGKPYDPRTGERAWSQNLPLLLLEYLTSDEGLNIPLSQIDLDDFKRAAKVADQLIPTKGGGTARRYHGSLSWRLDEQPKDVIQRAIMMMDGHLFLQPDGKVGFRVGEWITPTVHIEDDLIIDAELRDMAAPVSEANEIVIKWTNPQANYTGSTSDPWRNEEAYRRAGGRYRNTTVELYGVQSHNHARRIAKILDARSNARWQGWITTSLAGLEAWDQRFIRVSYSDLGIEAETFEVVGIAFDEAALTVTLNIISADPDRYAFNPATEEGTAPINPSALGDDAVPTPQSFKVDWSAETIRKERVISAALSVKKPRRNVNDPDDKDADSDDVTAEWQYCRADTGRWRTIKDRDEDMETEVEGLREGRLYDFRVRFRTSTSEPGDWALIENEKAIDPYPPSAPPKVLGKIVKVGSKETVRLTITAPDDIQTAGLAIYRDNESTVAGSTLVDTVECEPGETVVWDDPKPVRNVRRWYWARALNGSNFRSRATAAKTNPYKV